MCAVMASLCSPFGRRRRSRASANPHALAKQRVHVVRDGAGVRGGRATCQQSGRRWTPRRRQPVGAWRRGWPRRPPGEERTARTGRQRLSSPGSPRHHTDVGYPLLFPCFEGVEAEDAGVGRSGRETLDETYAALELASGGGGSALTGFIRGLYEVVLGGVAKATGRTLLATPRRTSGRSKPCAACGSHRARVPRPAARAMLLSIDTLLAARPPRTRPHPPRSAAAPPPPRAAPPPPAAVPWHIS
eukprot:TRINITY_DN8333_c0_g2_i1.p4 TRINITY_DN8333_c0_g2~~TRINITY_DN8333_c0_g2_i1.p4  ORF type:complete len:245 (+),score=26.43 TRINITY_DN8333_c0_g2_i1:1105-1839(+)